MFWRIMQHASACLASGKLILLDLRQDRYFLVPNEIARDFEAWLETRHACPPPPSIVALLERSGILKAGDPDPTNGLRDRVMIPTSLEMPDIAPGGGKAAMMLLVGTTWLRLRTRPLHRILALRQTRQILPVTGHADAVRIAAATYDASRDLVPIARNCLLDSLALDRFLARRGLGATMVFGVTSNPFSAHCWLQTGDGLLNDTYDHVSRFSPILAL